MSADCRRILLMIKSLGQGGAERQFCLLAGQLQSVGYEVCVVVYDQGDSFFGHLMPASVRLESLQCSNRWNLPKLLYRLHRIIAEFNPDIAYGFMSHSNLLLLIAKMFQPIRVACGVRSSQLDFDNEKPITRFGEHLHNYILRFANCIIANSRTGANELIAKGIAPSKVDVVPNGIETERFTYDAAARIRIRHEHQFDDGDIVIGMFARFHSMKGHRILLQATAMLLPEFPMLKIFLVGNGDYTFIQELKEIAVAGEFSDCVVFLGKQSNIEQYYSALDLYCSASVSGEGFPNALSEAMSIGIPCVATDVGDSALVLEGFGEPVPPGDAEALATALRKAVIAGPKGIIEAQRQSIESRFGVNQFRTATVAALNKTMDS